MAEPLIPTGFWSYTRVDDEASGKRLAQVSDALIAELQVQIGGPSRVQIFRDFSDIPLGSTWEQELNAALDRSSFLIPIVTPSFLHSEWCRKELLRFRQREIALGRNDLIFAVRYIDVRHVTTGWPEAEDGAELTALLDARQALDFTALRHADPKSEPVARQVERLAVQIRNALRRDPPRMAVSGSGGVAGLGSGGAAPASAALGSEPAEGPTTGTSAAPSAPTMPERMGEAAPPVGSAQISGGTTTQAAPSAGAGTDTATTMGGRQTSALSRGWSYTTISKGIAAVLGVVVGLWWASAPTPKPPVPVPQPAPSTPTAPAPGSSSSSAPAAQPLPLPTQPVPPVPAPVALPVPPPPPPVPTPGSEELTECGHCPTMVLLPDGRFQMGATEEEEKAEKVPEWARGRSRPTWPMTINQPFYMGKFPVTRGQYAIFADRTKRPVPDECTTYEQEQDKTWSWKVRKGRSWQDPGFGTLADQDRHPVVCVSDQDADDYVTWLNKDRGYNEAYFLPGETRWEYAARAVRSETVASPARYWGGGSACAYANVADAALARRTGERADAADRYFQCDDGFPFTSPVGRFRPNAFGLHDILGNVWQLTSDCWNPNYKDKPPLDGSRWTTGGCSSRPLRGGSWVGYPGDVRAAYRVRVDSGVRLTDTGFRVARTLFPP